jgi:hypothetical protein
MLFDGRLFREGPRQHELGFEDGVGAIDDPIHRGRHPPDDGMMEAALDVSDALAGVALVPGPIERLGDDADLDDQIAREVLRLNFAPLAKAGWRVRREGDHRPTGILARRPRRRPRNTRCASPRRPPCADAWRAPRSPDEAR